MRNLTVAVLENLKDKLVYGGKYNIPSVLLAVINTELFTKIEAIVCYDEHLCSEIIKLLDAEIVVLKEAERKAYIDAIITVQKESVAEMIARINAINCNI